MSFDFEPVQALESRRMLSAAAFHHGHTLVVRGDEQAANTIVVKPNAENTAIEVSIKYTTQKGVAKTVTASFPKTLDIRELRVRGGRGDDSITIEQAPAPAPTTPATTSSSRSGKHGRKDNKPFDGVIDARVETHAGNDTVTTGAGDDRVRSGAGNDVVNTGGGDDRVRAGDGDDVVNTGDGDDRVRAGAGNDSVDAGAGNDVVFSQRGNDLAKGGDGNDILWGGLGDDTLEGGAGDDKLGGVLGVNTMTGGAGKDTFVVRTLTGQTSDYNNAEDVLLTLPTKLDKWFEKDESDDDDDDDSDHKGNGGKGKRK